uniref:Uncharacterized protein n=1 Tax=Zea mays TaxID=4577 RepID=A0A804M7R4_MAIZE
MPPLERHHGRGRGRARARDGHAHPHPHPFQGLADPLHGEVEHGGLATHGERRLVVRQRRRLGAVEGAQPHAHAVARGVPDLRRELAPRTLAHPAVGPPAASPQGPFCFFLLRRRPLLPLPLHLPGDHVQQRHLVGVVAVECEHGGGRRALLLLDPRRRGGVDGGAWRVERWHCHAGLVELEG